MNSKFVCLSLSFTLTACSLYEAVDDCVQEQLVNACRADEAFALETERSFDFKQCLGSREKTSLSVFCTKGLANN